VAPAAAYCAMRSVTASAVPTSAAARSPSVSAIARAARSKRVRCATLTAASDLPYQEIIATARRKKCDLIMMASHGRRGLSALMHGSETRAVLTHSTIPTLVYR